MTHTVYTGIYCHYSDSHVILGLCGEGKRGLWVILCSFGIPPPHTHTLSLFFSLSPIHLCVGRVHDLNTLHSRSTLPLERFFLLLCNTKGYTCYRNAVILCTCCWFQCVCVCVIKKHIAIQWFISVHVCVCVSLYDYSGQNLHRITNTQALIRLMSWIPPPPLPTTRNPSLLTLIAQILLCWSLRWEKVEFVFAIICLFPVSVVGRVCASRCCLCDSRRSEVVQLSISEGGWHQTENNRSGGWHWNSNGTKRRPSFTSIPSEVHLSYTGRYTGSKSHQSLRLCLRLLVSLCGPGSSGDSGLLTVFLLTSSPSLSLPFSPSLHPFISFHVDISYWILTSTPALSPCLFGPRGSVSSVP